VPEALAYASIAGVSSVVDLYAALAALVSYAAFGSSKHLVVSYRPLVWLYRLHTSALGHIYGHAARADLIAAVAALAGVLIFDTLPGLFIGIGVSVLLIVHRASRPHVAVFAKKPGTQHWVDVERDPDAVRSVDVVVVRPESELFYVNADNVHAAINSHITDRTRAVVLDLESVPAIDFTATEMLRTLDDELTSSGVRLVIAREAGQVGDLLRQAGAGHLVVRDGVAGRGSSAVVASHPCWPPCSQAHCGYAYECRQTGGTPWTMTCWICIGGRASGLGPRWRSQSRSSMLRRRVTTGTPAP
jgi:MFS superfamily sulfate permease-like transporter